jgi:alpha-tubulin suppressor-like RCC1 family protein
MVAAVGASRGSGCADPTQVTLVINTDVPCGRWGGASIRVAGTNIEGSSAPNTSTLACADDGTVGTLVLVPQGDKASAVSVEILAGVGRDPESCAGAGFGDGCIRATRALAYIASRPLRLPVSMRLSCNGIVCASGDTCVRGLCRKNSIDDPARCASLDGCGEDALNASNSAACASGAFDCVGDAPRACVDGRWVLATGCADPTPLCRAGACVRRPVIAGHQRGGGVDRGGTTCATLFAGDTWCWGLNERGRVGDGTTTTRLTPVRVKTSRTHLSVGLSQSISCGLGIDGFVECWGGSWGLSPSVVPGIANAVDLAVGLNHACAVTAAGALFCWGDNTAGQSSGDGTVAPSVGTTQVAGLPPTVVKVATGLYHTCALLKGGEVRCWGLDGDGALGDGLGTARRVPTNPVLGVPGAVEVRAGFQRTCVRLPNGDVSCWGRTPSGNGVDSNAFAPSRIWTNGAALGGTSADGGCNLRVDGTVGCWGYNQHGETGDGTVNVKTLSPTLATGITTAIAVGTGMTHACALLRDGTMMCWGSNLTGQLGDGTTTDRPSPVRVLFN